MKLRGHLALIIVCSGLLVFDVVQRLVVAPWVKLRPRSRIAVLGAWQQFLAAFVLNGFSRVAGASIPPALRRIPCAPGHLILMNHQSLLDIPLVVRSLERGYPRIVTRARYGRFIPTISHMTRLYQYPFVDPTAGRDAIREALDEVEAAGRASDVPIVVFPEGTRSRTGRVGKLQSGALGRLLRARSWTVHVVVADGFFRVSRFWDFARGAGLLRGKFAYVGAREWSDPAGDPYPFIAETRRLMEGALDDLRGLESAA